MVCYCHCGALLEYQVHTFGEECSEKIDGCRNGQITIEEVETEMNVITEMVKQIISLETKGEKQFRKGMKRSRIMASTPHS